MKNTLIIVPAYNEEQRIASVIRDLHHHGYGQIVVIDDGSGDRTGQLAEKAGAVILRHRLNRGLGAALGTGFAYARKIKADCLVTFDADGQHQAEDLRKILTQINKGYDVVIGSRLINSDGMPVDRKIINRLSNLLTLVLYGVRTTDSQSGLRAFSRKAINAINLKTERMEVSSEFFHEIGTYKLKFTEVPIKAVYTDYSLKKGQGGKGTLNAFSVGFKMLLRQFR